MGGNGKRPISARPRHLCEPGAAKAASGRKERHGLEHIGLARAILAGQHDQPRPRRDQGVAVGAEVGEAEAGEGHG